jgi:hypothetical protein
MSRLLTIFLLVSAVFASFAWATIATLSDIQPADPQRNPHCRKLRVTLSPAAATTADITVTGARFADQYCLPSTISTLTVPTSAAAVVYLLPLPVPQSSVILAAKINSNPSETLQLGVNVNW